MNAEELSEALKALAVPSRLKIIELLSTRSYCVNALTARLDISQPAVSQHLAVLKRAGLVDASKAGTKVHYRVSTGKLVRVLEALAAFGAVGVSSVTEDRMHPRTAILPGRVCRPK